MGETQHRPRRSILEPEKGSMDMIPTEILHEILAKLPTSRDVARSSCVSRLWRAVVSDPSFRRHGGAPTPRRRNRVSVVVFDATKQAYLIFSLKMKHIFSDRPDESDHEVQRFFPLPLALFELADCCEWMDFAAHGGNNVIAVTSRARTLVYDADSDSVSAGPGLCAIKRVPILVPVGEDGAAFVAMSFYPHGAGPHFESLDLAAGPPCWRVIPELPGPRSDLMDADCSEVKAYFVAGTSVWVSLHGMGTFSFDTASRQWRKEGTWLLPVIGRAVWVPDLAATAGGPLLFAFCSHAAHLCACDIEASPPVIRVRWEDNAYPYNWCDRNECGMSSSLADLTYFGGGRFCTAIKMRGGYKGSLNFLCITALEVTADLQLLHRRFRCYLMEPDQEIAYFVH